MGEHERKNVRARLEFCNTCNRQTLHDVFDGRGSSCQNPHATRLSKKQEKAQKERQKAEDEPTLFSDNDKDDRLGGDNDGSMQKRKRR